MNKLLLHKGALRGTKGVRTRPTIGDQLFVGGKVELLVIVQPTRPMNIITRSTGPTEIR